MNKPKPQRKDDFARYWDDVLNPASNSPQAREYRRRKRMQAVTGTPLSKTIENLLNVKKKDEQ